MELTAYHDREQITIRINGEIDEQGAEMLKAKFDAIDKASTKKVILDFTSVTHIGSAGIGKLLLLYKNIAIQGGHIEINNLSETIYNMLIALKLESVFKLKKA